VNWPARSRTRNLSSGPLLQIHHEIAGLLSRPRTVRVPREAEDVHVAVADLHREQHVDPPQRDRAVHVEEIHGQHARGLGAQEPSPGRIGRPRRRRWYPPALEDSAYCRGSDAVAKFEQFAPDPLIVALALRCGAFANAGTVQDALPYLSGPRVGTPMPSLESGRAGRGASRGGPAGISLWGAKSRPAPVTWPFGQVLKWL